jgi:hypothetical protein
MAIKSLKVRQDLEKKDLTQREERNRQAATQYNTAMQNEIDRKNWFKSTAIGTSFFGQLGDLC